MQYYIRNSRSSEKAKHERRQLLVREVTICQLAWSWGVQQVLSYQIFLEVRGECLGEVVHVSESADLLLVIDEDTDKLQAALDHASKLDDSFKGCPVFFQPPANTNSGLGTG